MIDEKIIEIGAAKIHESYLKTCEKLGWRVNPVNMVPYEKLHEDANELDRASFMASIETLRELGMLKD